jgi:hypothetical protein
VLPFSAYPYAAKTAVCICLTAWTDADETVLNKYKKPRVEQAKIEEEGL